MPTWMPIPLLYERDFVVLNGFDDGNKTFYSMSVQAATDEIPGSSIYEAKGVAKHGPKDRVRMAFFSAMRVEQDQKNPDRAILHYFQVSFCDRLTVDRTTLTDMVLCLMQWMDLLGMMPEFISNFGNVESYSGFIERVNDKYPVPTTTQCRHA
jgi:hypothetical protein